ncbi:MAG: right-handed parallel beta-helix repeat-containing protein [Alistipes sp.]|nr:right-handed parallel beta-helix repeat-containing protein [Alistipes sp.]
MKARFFALAALVLGLASCQQEFDGAATQVGGEVDFQLKVDAKELATRANDGDSQYGFDSAYGAIDYLCDEADLLRVDWTDVDLRYSLEVYDANGLNAAPVKDRMVQIVDKYEPVTFDLRLVPNRDYQFVVFADFVPQDASDEANTEVQSKLGLHHDINGTLQNITIKEDAINDECTDAYFATEPIRISNSAAQSIVLKRPYGKVRVIATDLAELNLNVEPKSVKVTYDAAHRASFNAVTGAIDTEYTTVEYTNRYNDVKKTDLSNHIYNADYDARKADANANGVVRHTHMTLFTDYILANTDQESIHFTMEVFDEQGNTIKATQFNTDIPVQRNYLTTIVGNVLTTATEINVTIDDNFKGLHERDFVLVNTAKELKEAINDYENGKIILFDADIKAEETILIKQNADVNVVIDGNGYKFDGGFYVDGLNRYTGEETLTFQNINFETTRDDLYFIDSNVAKEYAHNVTVKNCTFKGNETVVGARLRQAFDIKFEGCEANDIHSLAQCYGVAGIVVDNVKTNTKNGVSFGTSTDAVVKNSTIVATGYGLRVDADGARTLVVENTSIKAFLPVVARKAKANYTINFVGDNKLEAPGYDVVFTTGDDEATFVAPAEYTVTGADNFKVFPRDNYNFVYTADDLKAAVAAGGDHLLMPTTIEGTFAVNKPIILKGVEGATIKGRVNVGSYGDGSQFKNLKFAINDASKAKNTYSGAQYKYPGIVVIYAAATSFDGCEFETNINAGVCGINYGTHEAGKKLVVNNCKFEGDFYPIRTRTLAEITNNKFDVYTSQGTLCAVWTWGNSDSGANSVVFENNTNVNKHGIYGVQVTSTTFKYDNIAFVVKNNNGFVNEFATNSACDYTNSTLNSAAIAVNTNALKAAVSEAGATVNVMAGEYTFPSSVAEGVTIVCEEGTVFTGNSKLDIKGATVVGATFSNPSGNAVDQTINGKFENCTFTGSNALRYCYVGETCEFENCVFDGSTYGIHFDGGTNKNVTFRNCTISGFNAFAAAINMVTFEGCTFVGNDKSGYNGANLWGSATLKNCEFTFDGTTQYEWIDCIKADGQYSFNNCTVNGVEYTSDNYTSFPDISSRNNVTVKINDVDCAL